jgi:hypothetical protein
MDDYNELDISLDSKITPLGLRISVKLILDKLNCNPKVIAQDSIVISNDELLAIAGKLD